MFRPILARQLEGCDVKRIYFILDAIPKLRTGQSFSSRIRTVCPKVTYVARRILAWNCGRHYSIGWLPLRSRSSRPWLWRLARRRNVGLEPESGGHRVDALNLSIEFQSKERQGRGLGARSERQLPSIYPLIHRPHSAAHCGAGSSPFHAVEPRGAHVLPTRLCNDCRVNSQR